MSEEYVVARFSELADGTHIVVEAGGREIGLFHIRGRLYALPNACFHQNGPLCRGKTSGTLAASAESGWKRQWVKEGEIIVCPWHGLEFDIPTGRCLAYPKRRLPMYDVRLDGDEVIVSLGRSLAGEKG